MQKQAPSIGRILVAAGFALSCFGLILFLWIAFGGPTPLKPKSYRITAYFPEATQLAVESDVRIGGVSVGKVKSVELAPPSERVDGLDTAEAEIEIQPEFAPISNDARAILRQKTLLGETYIELTAGTEPDGDTAPIALGAAANVTDAEAQNVESIEEGGTLDVSRTENATQIDEIFNALDEETRVAFQRWQQNAAVAVEGRGLDLSDSFGNLGPFIGDATEILGVLKKQKVALKGLVRDTGTVFAALSERDQDLAGAIVGAEGTFGALADADESLAESFQILPTFQRETRATLLRLDEFQADTRPLVRKLLPVANDISPTLKSVRELAPHLENLFVDLDPLIDAADKGLPALRDVLGPEGVRPLLDALDPFLANLNPAVGMLSRYRTTVTDFLATPGVALSGSLETQPGQPAARHYLKQLAYLSSEALSVWPTRLPGNRGNAYPAPNYLSDPRTASRGMFPNFDCKNTDFTPVTGGDPDEDPRAFGDGGTPEVGVAFGACWIQDNFPADEGGLRAPNLFADP
jgi:ABC-type transporter Mla subunit MlaD